MAIAATYYDGQAAAGRRVEAAVVDQALVIIGDDDQVLDRWPCAEVHLTGDPRSGEPPRLRRGYDGDARLVLLDPADLSSLAGPCPDLSRTAPPFRSYARQVVIWGLTAAVAVVIIFKGLLPLLAQQIAVRLPAAWHQRVGEAALTQIKSVIQTLDPDAPEDLVCYGEPGRTLVAVLGNRLAAATEETPSVWVTILDTDLVNALALPGGRIVIFRGLIDFVETPEELAMALAHEVGHVAKRHPIKLAVENVGASFMIGILFGDVFGGTVLAGFGTVMLNASHGREAEREADAVGIDVLTHLDFDRRKAAKFFERLAEKQSGIERNFGFLLSHPASEERAEAVRKGPLGRARLWEDTQWRAVQKACD